MTGRGLWSETTELPVFTLTIKLAERGMEEEEEGLKDGWYHLPASLSFYSDVLLWLYIKRKSIEQLCLF